MTLQEIKALAPLVKEWTHPVGCHLYLWVTNNHLPDGLEVMKAWGFDFKTMITWGKITNEGIPAIGLGQYFRGATEHCLFGTSGFLPYRMTMGREPEAVPKRAQGRTLILVPRQEHSQKPQTLMDMVELVSHPPYLEMFARTKRLGWEAWGLEAPQDSPQQSSPAATTP